MSNDANLIVSGVTLGLSVLFFSVLLAVFIWMEWKMNKYRKLRSFFTSNPRKSVLDQDPDADLRSRKGLDRDTVPVLNESVGYTATW